jgi:hypothetical protein
MNKNVPFYFTPRPQQQEAWWRMDSGDYDYYFKVWHRQFGKDSLDIQHSCTNAFLKPGTQTAYVGPDNKWIRRNVWDKYLDGRRHWASYPAEIIDPKETQQQVKFHNNGEDKAEALIQFIGLKESESLVGSSYDFFYFSDLSLFKRRALDYLPPIWDNKITQKQPLLVSFNLTPRGMSNISADMLRAYTGCDDPADWPGAHGRVFVDVMDAQHSLLGDGTRLYSDEDLEKIRQRSIRADGNDNRFRQEMMVEFLTTDAGLVYPASEYIRSENRFSPFNLSPAHPVYMAWDISSKGKESDWTTAIIFQYYDGKLFIFDEYRDNRKSVVACVQELAGRDYFHRIRAAALPWDADRSGSENSPYVECRNVFPNIDWRLLKRGYQVDGINDVRNQLPNTYINSNHCDWLMECLESWEYMERSSGDDWGPPKHDIYSHTLDALMYCVNMLKQIPYLRTNSGMPVAMPAEYPAWRMDEEEEDKYAGLPIGMRPSKLAPKRKSTPRGYQNENDGVLDV